MVTSASTPWPSRRSDRIRRLGQDKPVTLHLPIAVHPDLGDNSFDVVLERDADRQERRGLAPGEQPSWPLQLDVEPQPTGGCRRGESLILRVATCHPIR